MSDTKINVNFACQRCFAPVKIDDTLDKINEHNLAELSRMFHIFSHSLYEKKLFLSVPIYSHTASTELEGQAMSFDQYVPPFRLTDSGQMNGTNGFTVISEISESEAISHKMKVKAELFDKLSANSDINHPLCEDCTDTLIEMIDKQLKLAEQDQQDYEEYLKKLDSTTDCTDLEQLAKELAELDGEEERLLKELETLKKQEESLNVSIKVQEEEDTRLKLEQLKYNREYTKFRRELMITEDETRSVENQLASAQMHYDNLKKTNVFNATFHIWHDGHFGTINKFRLGRLPSVPVDWSEINAAWGQTALLLASLARKMNLTFNRFKLVPYGDHSYLEELETGKQLPLHGTGGIKFYWDTKFDAAMVAFLDCLQQFKDEVEKGGSGFCLPYKMEKGKIEDSATGIAYSIK